MASFFQNAPLEEDERYDPTDDYEVCTRCGRIEPYYCMHCINDYEMLCGDCYEEMLREEEAAAEAEAEEQALIRRIKATPVPELPNRYNFNAIFFGIANSNLSSICSVGLVFVREGKIVGKYGTLVHPKPDDYDAERLNKLGLVQQDIENAPNFRKAWNKIRNEVKRDWYPLVAYHAGFHKQCLQAALRSYNMEWPMYRFVDIRRESGKFFGDTVPDLELCTVARACGYDLSDYHDPVACAEACVSIAMKVLPEYAL